MTLPHGQPDRRRVQRVALRLNATARERGRNRVPIRIVDISTHGCRVEMLGGVFVEESIWLSIAGLETQPSRIVWHQDDFAGLEFMTPLSEVVLDGLLATHNSQSEAIVKELRELASRAHHLSTQSPAMPGTADLVQFSRDCSVQAIVHGLKLAEKANGGADPPQLTGSMIRRGESDRPTGSGFSFHFSGSAP